MTPSTTPFSTAANSHTCQIKASLAEQSGRSLFRLTFQGDSVVLSDSSCLNRWAAVGIVARHRVSLIQSGVSIDGHDFLYQDPNATTALEAFLNRPGAPPKAAAHSKPPASSHTVPDAVAGEVGHAANFADGVHVTRDGFEFHVGYRTRFGENKTDKLEAALEAFQRMRAFQPHINVQKSGIRLVVTRWDGENFMEEGGIENLEHASPEEVQSIIRRNLQGGSARDLSNLSAANPPAKAPVVRVQVVRKPHEARCHLVFHRQDGSTEEGPVLIRPNMPKLVAGGLFLPDTSISMTALSDRITIEHGAVDGPGRRSETFRLENAQELEQLESLLNSCLQKEPSLSPGTVTNDGEAHKPIPNTFPHSRTAGAPSVDPPRPHPIPAAVAPSLPAANSPCAESTAPPLPSESALPLPEPNRVELVPDWTSGLFRNAQMMAPEDINTAIFTALRDRFERPVSSNDHGFPSFTVEWPGVDPAMEAVLVLTSHGLLCTFPFGYARFGHETRFFLNPLDDYVSFPHAALCGLMEDLHGGQLSFVVSDECGRFLRSHADRNYRSRFAPLVKTASEFSPGYRLLWPLCHEDRLFQMAALTATNYGLPVESDRIVLVPKSPVFIGFLKVSPHGMEFRDGDDFVRFTPWQFELSEGGEFRRFLGSNLLRGWALDGEGRVCAVYRPQPGFEPPNSTKLLRFFSEAEHERERDSLTILAWL